MHPHSWWSGDKDTFAPGGIRRASLCGGFISCFGGGQQRRVRVFLHWLFFQGNNQYAKLAYVGSTCPESLEQQYPSCCPSCSLGFGVEKSKARPSSAQFVFKHRIIYRATERERERGRLELATQLCKVSTCVRKWSAPCKVLALKRCQWFRARKWCVLC